MANVYFMNHFYALITMLSPCTTFRQGLKRYCAMLSTDDAIFSILHSKNQTVFDSLIILHNLSI
jgi:hypothetical protein